MRSHMDPTANARRIERKARSMGSAGRWVRVHLRPGQDLKVAGWVAPPESPTTAMEGGFEADGTFYLDMPETTLGQMFQDGGEQDEED
jgi:hypothetical protein